MKRKDAPPLTPEDLAEFVAQKSDFRFEMDVLRQLRTEGFDANHAATYVDPLSNKIRAYDFRARWSSGSLVLRLAVECKNLSASSPVLVYATPREEVESFHSLVKRTQSGGIRFNSAHLMNGAQSAYKSGLPVGRQIEQPIKEGGGFKASDAQTFDKWMQAVNGCADLIKQTVADAHGYPSLQGIVPMLVVPDGCLWQVEFDSDGVLTCPPCEATTAQLILRHTWTAQTSMGPVNYDVSHLEIVCISAIARRLAELRGQGGLFVGAETILEGH